MTEQAEPELTLRRDAVLAGWTDDELGRLVRAGELERLRRGAYVSGFLPPDVAPNTADAAMRRRMTSTDPGRLPMTSGPRPEVMARTSRSARSVSAPAPEINRSSTPWSLLAAQPSRPIRPVRRSRHDAQ